MLKIFRIEEYVVYATMKNGKKYNKSYEDVLYTNDKNSIIRTISQDPTTGLVSCIIIKGRNNIKFNDEFVLYTPLIPTIGAVRGEIIDFMGNIITPNATTKLNEKDMVDIRSLHSVDIKKNSNIRGRQIHTGVKAIDFLWPIREGDLVVVTGIAGAGKSVLMESIIEGIQRNIQDGDTSVVYAGIGERDRELLKLYDNMGKVEGNVKEKTVFIGAPMGTTLAGGRRQAWELAKEYIKMNLTSGYNALTIVDNIYRLMQAAKEVGYVLQNHTMISSSMESSYISKSFGYIDNDSEIRPKLFSTGIFTNLAPNEDDLDLAASKAEDVANVVIRLNPKVSPNNFPPYDILNCKSTAFEEGFTEGLSERHIYLRNESWKLLKHYLNNKDNKLSQTTILNESETIRAKHLEKLLTQNVIAGKEWSGEGDIIDLEDVLNIVEKILGGMYDNSNIDTFEKWTPSKTVN